MVDDTLILDLVRAGVPSDLVTRVAALIVSAEALRNSAEVTEKRRAKDRERKAKKAKEINDVPKANDVGTNPQNSAETEKVCTNESFFPIRESELLEKKERVSQRSKKELVERVRSTRIDADWQPSEADRQFAIDHGVADVDTLRAEFIDYWISVPGQRGLKTGDRGWSATWRNRVRQVGTGKANGASHGKRRHSAKDAVDLFIARAESFERENDLGPVIDAEPSSKSGKADHR